MWRRYVLSVLPEIGDPREEGWPPESLRKYDDVSFARFLRDRGASPAAVALLRLDVFDLYGQGFESMSALAFLRDWAAFSQLAPAGPEEPGEPEPVAEEEEAGEEERGPRVVAGVIDGGSDRLPEALAAGLSNRIRYGAEVLRIEQDAEGVRVAVRSGGRRETVEGDRLVCTIPFPALREIEFSPTLPADKRRAIRNLPYSTITRVYLQVRRRFWEDVGASGEAYADLPVPRVLVHPMARATDRAVLEAHTGKDVGSRLAERSEEERIAFALEHLERIHPGARRYAEGGTSYAWPADPWVRGGYSSYAPGQVFALLPVVARPEGRIHFAGEHTSRLSASMDGALESGMRAAGEVDAADR